MKLTELFVLTLLGINYANCSVFKNMIKNGCSAYGCHRICAVNELSTASLGDNGFSLEFANISEQTSMYVPDTVYKGKWPFQCIFIHIKL